MYCSKWGSPELSKYFTSEGPSRAFCQDEEAKKEPPAQMGGGKCPFVLAREIKSAADSFNTSSQATQGQEYQRKWLPFSLAEESESRCRSRRNQSFFSPVEPELHPPPPEGGPFGKPWMPPPQLRLESLPITAITLGSTHSPYHRCIRKYFF